MKNIRKFVDIEKHAHASLENTSLSFNSETETLTSKNIVRPVDFTSEYTTFEVMEETRFSFEKTGTGDDIMYSTDGGDTWTSLPSNEYTPVFVPGKTIKWKSRITPSSSLGIGRFMSDGRFKVYGNSMSLLFGDDFADKTDLTGLVNAFYSLFASYEDFGGGVVKPVDAANFLLPAMTLEEKCYSYMFVNTKTLAYAPELPAETLKPSCYASMFSGCLKLVTTPELPATTLATKCYEDMFSRCYRLEEATELPANELSTGCYKRMFYYCTNITKVPELKAKRLVSDCYYEMFAFCKKLDNVTILATGITNSNYMYNWLYNTSATGTVTKMASMHDLKKNDNSGVPANWVLKNTDGSEVTEDDYWKEEEEEEDGGLAG